MTPYPVQIITLSLAVAFLGCQSSPQTAGKRACVKFRSSSELNDSTALPIILVGVTNPDKFRTNSPEDLLSDDPPGTEGKPTEINIAPGESGKKCTTIDPLSKRLAVIADYRNRRENSKIAVDLRVATWIVPSIDFMKDTIDD